jgi:hypothetical protein
MLVLLRLTPKEMLKRKLSKNKTAMIQQLNFKDS